MGFRNVCIIQRRLQAYLSSFPFQMNLDGFVHPLFNAFVRSLTVYVKYEDMSEGKGLWQVLTLNVKEKLKPVVEFFRSMGLNNERDIEMLLVRNAQILCCSIEKNLRPKFIYFKGLGLTEKSIANMIVLFPSMLGQSIEGSLGPKLNYLIYEMNRPVEEIVLFPQVGKHLPLQYFSSIFFRPQLRTLYCSALSSFF